MENQGALAASTTESAIVDSTRRDGSEMIDRAARLSVIECASVNAVTIRSTSQNTGVNRAAGPQARCRRMNTAGKSSETSTAIIAIGGNNAQPQPEW